MMQRKKEGKMERNKLRGCEGRKKKKEKLKKKNFFPTLLDQTNK